MIDWTKPIVTRDGLPARVICTDRKFGESEWTHIVLYMDEGYEMIAQCDIDGNAAHRRLFVRNVEEA